MANVTIDAYSDILPAWPFAGTTAKLRIFSSKLFLTSEDETVVGGSAFGGMWSTDYDCAIVAGHLHIPAIAIDSTTDGEPGDAKYYAVLVNEAGLVVGNWLIEFAVPPTPTSQTWTFLRQYNFPEIYGPLPPPAIPTGLRATVLGTDSIRWDWDSPDTSPPTVPTMNAPTVISDTEIDVSWSAATDNVAVTGYDLQIALDAGFSSGLMTLNLGNVTSHNFTGLTASTQYYFRVRAHDAVPNNSAYSSSVNATTDAHVFGPADEPGLWTWLKADAQSYLDGDLMGTFVDSSGNGRDATSPGPGNRPTFKTAIANGHPIARYLGDGTANHFTLPDTSALTAGEVFIVVKLVEGVPVSLGNCGLWAFGDTDDTLFPFNSNGKIYECFGTTVRKDAIDITGIDFSDGFHIYNVVSAAGHFEIFIDGVSVFSTGTNTVAFTASPKLGTSHSTGEWLHGDEPEFILYDHDLGNTVRGEVTNYLRTKYATP